MTCSQADELIEAVAAGDEPASDAFRQHVESCLRCASSLAAARRVDMLLRARPAPAAPARFTAGVAARIRRERWRSEQQLDRVFNLALIGGLLVVVVGVVGLLNLSALSGAISAATTMLSRGSAGPAPAQPSLTTYMLATALLGTTLAAWWWAERRFSG